jgi:uncharacterized phage protein (TIGR02218 family)
MKTLQPALAAHLAGEATTLARCWVLTRTDGVVMGFTDHDRDLTIAGVSCRAATGLDAAEAGAELGFAVGGGDVSGALSSAGLTEADLAAGRYDGATAVSWLVNWDDPAQALVTGRAVIGEIRRSDAGFVAELRGEAHRFDEERGRLFTAGCSADFGDARCGMALAPHGGTISATDGRFTLTCVDLPVVPDGWFTGGRLTLTGGGNAGFSTEVKLHRAIAAEAEFSLWQGASSPMLIGDAFIVTFGCDKSFATCRDRFGNAVNFRGFPQMPGNDALVRIARQGEAGMDGGSLLR